MNAAPSNIRPAASVLVLRDSPAGMQVLLMRRPERGDNDFRSGACVFPGGVLDKADRDAWCWCLGQDDAQASARLGLREGGLDYFVAALRECFEEVGLLFVCHPDGSPVDLAPHADDLSAWRHRLHEGRSTMAALCEAFDWRLDLRDMAYYSHWLTPVLRPKRFDTRFFVRLAPADQQALPDMGEALEIMWLTPDEALDPARALKLLNVTQRTLHDMRGFAGAQAACDHALALRGVALHLPRPALGAEGMRFIIEDHPAYDEIAHLDPDHRGDLRCELRPGDVQRLSPRLVRVAGARRHAYVVTDSRGDDAAVIGADTDDAAQAQALRAQWPHARALRAPGPQPRAIASAALATGSDIALGADTHLRPLQGALLLVEDGIVLGGDALAAQWADTGAAWAACAQGFLQRIAPLKARAGG